MNNFVFTCFIFFVAGFIEIASAAHDMNHTMEDEDKVVCFNGFIMDEFCIERGRLLDTNDVTLENPDRHTVHCLIDVSQCRNSGYWILEDPSDGSNIWNPLVKLDHENGRQMMVDFGKQVGACDICDGGYGSGQSRGLRATIFGTLCDDKETFVVTKIQEGNIGCDGTVSGEVLGVTVESDGTGKCPTTANDGGSMIDMDVGQNIQTNGVDMEAKTVIAITASIIFSCFLMYAFKARREK